MEIPGELTERLKALGQRENATPFMTLIAAFQTLLHRYTGQTDLVVGTPIANRTRVETEGLIGFFANTLVMRADLSGNPSFREALRRDANDRHRRVRASGPAVRETGRGAATPAAITATTRSSR